MNLLRKADRILSGAIIAIACTGMAAITLIICLQVIRRYVMGSSLAWAEELSLYIEVYVIFLSSGYALGKGQHICMDLVVTKVPYPVAVVLNKLSAAACLAFSIAMTCYCWTFTTAEMGQKMAALPGYKWMVYLAMVIGSALMVLYSVVLLVKKPEPRQNAGAAGTAEKEGGE